MLPGQPGRLGAVAAADGFAQFGKVPVVLLQFVGADPQELVVVAVDVLVDGVSVEQSTRGAILGEMALIDSSPRGATVRALEPSCLARVDVRRFNFIIQQNPFFARHVMKVLVDRLRHMNRVLAGGSPQ